VWGEEYAFDFGLDDGDPIAAAHPGVVSHVRDTMPTGGCSGEYANSANYVVVDHQDGTSALYLHLLQGSARVHQGDPVRQGQIIGSADHSGWACGSHLHFQVQSNTTCHGGGVYCASIPVFFDDLGRAGAALTGPPATYQSDNAASGADQQTPVYAYLSSNELGLIRGTTVVARVHGLFEGVGDGWNPADSFHFTSDGKYVFAVLTQFGSGAAATLVSIAVATGAVGRIVCDCGPALPEGGSTVVFGDLAGHNPTEVDLSRPATPQAVPAGTKTNLAAVYESGIARIPTSSPATAYGGARVAYDEQANYPDGPPGPVVLFDPTANIKTMINLDTTLMVGCRGILNDLWWATDGHLYATVDNLCNGGTPQFALWRLDNTQWSLVNRDPYPAQRYLGGTTRAVLIANSPEGNSGWVALETGTQMTNVQAIDGSVDAVALRSLPPAAAAN
jgi:hypothetical protein